MIGCGAQDVGPTSPGLRPPSPSRYRGPEREKHCGDVTPGGAHRTSLPGAILVLPFQGARFVAEAAQGC